MKKWAILRPDDKAVAGLLGGTDLSRLAAEVLSARGISETDELRNFFGIDGELSDPFLLSDMAEAADIINAAIDAGTKICIYGDYDCDGVTATVMLYSYLDCMGADVCIYIPERSEGYGMSEAAVRKLADDGTELIITVDNGISAINEAELIYELGMRLIITDHHQPSDTLPKAEAIVNPHRSGDISPFKPLCGAGVALKLIAALDGGDYTVALEQFSDLAAIGTIADIVSLTGENRLIVSHGLRLLANTENIGLAALMEISGVSAENMSSSNVAFMLAPRINAAGRFGSPMQAVRLLLSEDEEEAASLAGELDRLNTERKSAENDIIKAIELQVENNPALLDRRVLVFYGEGWHHGVIGIVAARLQERFGKPVVMLTVEGDTARGSVRSFGDFSVFKMLQHCSPLLSRWGGHMGAGGFTVKSADIERLTDEISRYSLENFSTMPILTLTADKLLQPADLTTEAAEGLSVLGPFGEGNREPLFVLASARIDEIIPLKGGAHTKLSLNYGGVKTSALLFGVKTDSFPLKKGETGDFAINMGINIYMERKSLSLIVRDYRKSGISQQKYFAAKDAYEKYRRGEGLPDGLISRMTPERTELETVYRLLGAEETELDRLFSRAGDMNYCKFRFSIDIFCELGLARLFPYRGTVMKLPAEKKVSLDSSALLRELRSAAAENTPRKD